MTGGHFSAWTQVANAPGYGVRGVADFNGDGNADVLLPHATAPAQLLFVNMHDGHNSGFATASSRLPTDWQARGVADVNNDGFADVIVQQQSTGVTIYAAQGPDGFDHWGDIAHVGTHWHVV